MNHELLIRLFKDGAKWEGDVLHKKWAEYVAVPHDVEHEVMSTLGAYQEGTDFQCETYEGRTVGVWVA